MSLASVSSFTALSAGVLAALKTRKCRINAKKAITGLDFSLTAHQIAAISTQLVAGAKKVDDQVAAIPLDSATYDNVIEPLVRYEVDAGPRFNNVTFLKDVSPIKSVRDASHAASQMLQDAMVERGMRQDVYRVVKAVQRRGMSGCSSQQRRLVDRMVRDFERNGLHLSVEKQAEAKEIKKRISQLGLQFSKNLGEDTSTVLVTREELAGMGEDFIDSLTSKDGKLVLTMKYPHVLPVMEKCDVDDTRRRVATAFQSRCMDTNVAILEELVELRHRLALLLGFSTHAEFALQVLMAKTPDTVNTFLNNLCDKLQGATGRERAALLEMKRELCAKAGRAFDGQLNSWDVRYLQRKVKERDYAVDEDEIRKYFPMEAVVDGMLEIYQHVLGLEFQQVASPHVWEEEVTLWEVRDRESKQLMGHFYMDLFPREAKYSHACCMDLRPGCLLADGTRRTPVCALIANFTKPSASRPSLLRHQEVETLFHEFGHGMHYLCARSEFPNFSAFGVEWDFVEMPSQMMENWCWEKEPLRRMSRHYKDPSRRIPDELVEKLARAKDANVAMLTQRQLSFGLFDMAIHTSSKADTAAVMREVSQRTTGVPPIEGTNFAASFGHMAGGYDAKYYGYMWSLVYATDAYESKFKAAGCMDASVGREYRRCILEPGATQDAMELLRNFLGRDPSDEAFLRSKGLL